MGHVLELKHQGSPFLNYLTSCIWELDPHRVADLAEVILIVDGAQDRNLLLWVKATKDQQHHRSEIF